MKRTNGWEVYVKRDHTSVRKWFGDKTHGGTELALEAATKFRDEILKDNPIVLKSKFVTKRSSSGIVGVFESVACFEGQWYDRAGFRVKQEFSKHKYGFYNARKLATIAKNLKRKINPADFIKPEKWAKNENKNKNS